MMVDSLAPADHQRIRLFVATHDEFVRAVVARRIGEADVDDVVQSVFIVAWRKFVGLADLPSASAQRVWLYRAAHNELLTRHRTNGRRTRLLAVIQHHQPIAGSATSPPLDDALMRSLDRLSDKQQRVIKAAYWDGLSSTEIGLLLDCSSTAARKQLSRALDQLRHWYAQEVDG